MTRVYISPGAFFKKMPQKQIYEPAEDSFLLAKSVKKLAKGKVLDMGTGSGIQAEIAASLNKVKSVLATDVNPYALRYIDSLDKKGPKYKYRKKIKTLKSDLFTNIRGKFDTIIFNPPYLPEEKGVQDDHMKRALTGGKRGWETIARFLDNASSHLEKNEKILLLFSSRTNKRKIDELIKEHLFDSRQIGKKKIFFEELYVYQLKKSKQLNDFEMKKIRDIKKLAHGHRGIVYQGRYNKRPVAIKIEKSKTGMERIKKEAQWLKLLNKHKIGPKFLFATKRFLVMELIQGQNVWDFVRRNDKTGIKKVLKNIFHQCYAMDKLKINKEEMHHPYKHIIIGEKVVMIDFERCKKTKEPKNVTQFCQFVTSTNFLVGLMDKNFRINIDKIRRLAKVYKSNMTPRNLEKIFKEIK